MIRFLGFEDLSPRYDAYNVCVSFDFPDKKKDVSRGENVAVVYVNKDTFLTNFSGVELGSQLPFNIGFNYVEYKEPQKGIYKPYLKL